MDKRWITPYQSRLIMVVFPFPNNILDLLQMSLIFQKAPYNQFAHQAVRT